MNEEKIEGNRKRKYCKNITNVPDDSMVKSVNSNVSKELSRDHNSPLNARSSFEALSIRFAWMMSK